MATVMGTDARRIDFQVQVTRDPPCLWECWVRSWRTGFEVVVLMHSGLKKKGSATLIDRSWEGKTLLLIKRVYCTPKQRKCAWLLIATQVVTVPFPHWLKSDLTVFQDWLILKESVCFCFKMVVLRSIKVCKCIKFEWDDLAWKMILKESPILLGHNSYFWDILGTERVQA